MCGECEYVVDVNVLSVVDVWIMSGVVNVGDECVV